MTLLCFCAFVGERSELEMNCMATTMFLLQGRLVSTELRYGLVATILIGAIVAVLLLLTIVVTFFGVRSSRSNLKQLTQDPLVALSAEIVIGRLSFDRE